MIGSSTLSDLALDIRLKSDDEGTQRSSHGIKVGDIGVCTFMGVYKVVSSTSEASEVRECLTRYTSVLASNGSG